MRLGQAFACLPLAARDGIAASGHIHTMGKHLLRAAAGKWCGPPPVVGKFNCLTRSSLESVVPETRRLSAVEWLICIISAIGFGFDIYALLVLPLILGPAVQELTGQAPGSETFVMWRGLMFFLPAAVGGIFGLLGGYLTDRLGRRRILTWSIFLYAFSAFAAGCSTSMGMLLLFRCMTFIGVCVEFVAAVAWLAELFPEPKRRERVLGYTQFFSSLGGMAVAYANFWIIQHTGELNSLATTVLGWIHMAPESGVAAAPWRYTLFSGVLPAIPLAVIRPFLPESPVWAAKKAAGTLKRPSITELFSPQLFRTTVVTTIMFALSYGAAFGAIQQIPQIVPALPELKAEIAEKTRDLPPPDAKRTAARITQTTAAEVTQKQEWGGLFGRLALALLVTVIVSRRKLLFVFLIPGAIILPLVFHYAATTSQSWLEIGIFFVGFFTVAQFSFWGNYLPRVYPVHLRGTGESFAANIGGRMIGTSFAWLASELSLAMPGANDAVRMAAAATLIGTGVYIGNIILCFFLPEPQHEELPE